MQHTETYNLNLIETDDVFSPAPLNENAEQTEAAILAEAAAREAAVAAEAAARAAADTALDKRVKTLEATKLVFGTYTGSGSDYTQTIELGFTPKAVFIVSKSNSTISYIAIQNSVAIIHAGTTALKIVKNGFTVGDYTNNGTFCYMAIA